MGNITNLTELLCYRETFWFGLVVKAFKRGGIQMNIESTGFVELNETEMMDVEGGIIKFVVLGIIVVGGIAGTIASCNIGGPAVFVGAGSDNGVTGVQHDVIDDLIRN